MTRKRDIALPVLGCGLLLAAAGLTGCSHATGTDTLEAQKASIMGGPAPASAKAQIDALRATQAQHQAEALEKAKAAAAAQKRP